MILIWFYFPQIVLRKIYLNILFLFPNPLLTCPLNHALSTNYTDLIIKIYKFLNKTASWHLLFSHDHSKDLSLELFNETFTWLTLLTFLLPVLSFYSLPSIDKCVCDWFKGWDKKFVPLCKMNYLSSLTSVSAVSWMNYLPFPTFLLRYISPHLFHVPAKLSHWQTVLCFLYDYKRFSYISHRVHALA